MFSYVIPHSYLAEIPVMLYSCNILPSVNEMDFANIVVALKNLRVVTMSSLNLLPSTVGSSKVSLLSSWIQMD